MVLKSDERCSEDFASKDNLTRHKNRKYRCDVLRTGGNQVCKGMRLNRWNSDDFNQDDFYCGGDSPSRNSNEDDIIPTLMVMNFVEINH